MRGGGGGGRDGQKGVVGEEGKGWRGEGKAVRCVFVCEGGGAGGGYT